jgi:hypothetical protein
MPRSAARRQERRNLVDGRISGAISAPYPGFIEPCHATQRDSVPKQGSWLHEIKHDGSPYSSIVSRCREIPQRRSRILSRGAGWWLENRE